MRRLSALGLLLVPLLTAAPAYAQSDDVASSSSGKLMVILAAVAAAIAMFLLIIILFGKGRSSSTANVQSRLGAYGGGSDSSGGFFSRFSFLRRAARSAETAAEKRGATNMIESALEQANVPMKPGEAIRNILANMNPQ